MIKSKYKSIGIAEIGFTALVGILVVVCSIIGYINFMTYTTGKMVEVLITQLPRRDTKDNTVYFIYDGKPENMVWEGGHLDLQVGQKTTLRYAEKYNRFLAPDFDPTGTWGALVLIFGLMEIYLLTKLLRGKSVFL